MKTLQQVQNEIRLTEAPSKGVVFMFGRFNPPTIGHEKMVKRAIAVAKRAGIRDVRLYPSFTQDSKRNPLAHKEKVKWLRKFFKGIKVIDDRDARTPFAAARKLSDEGVKRVIMIAGGDRVKEFQSQISKYIKHKDPDKSFEFDEFQVVSAGERDPDAEDASGMSASKMRGFAAAKDFGNFLKGVPSRAKKTDASALFAALRKAMNLRESTFQLSAEQRDTTFIQRLKDLKGPDIAENGKCYAVVWADGRGVVAYRNRLDAMRFIEQGGREVVSIRYQDAARESGRSLIVRNSFSPDRSTIGEEWPDTLETYDVVLARINEDFEQLDEVTESRHMWYNSSKDKFVKVGRLDTHAHTVLAKPKEFGLKKADLAKFGKLEGANFAKLIEFMKLNRWARVSVATKDWFIEANNLSVAKKTVQALDQKFARPKNIFIEHGRLSTNLSGNQIVPFLKTGKVVRLSKLAAFRDHVELDEAITSVWWYNSRTKKSVKVTGKFFIHADVIEQAPEKLGLTDKDVLSMSGAKKNDLATRDFYSDKLADLLKKRGWAQLSVSTQLSRDNEAIIRTHSSREAQRALKWILNNISPTLGRVFIANNKAPANIDLRGRQIDQFAKTGKGGAAVSKLAAFRETHLDEQIRGIDKWWYDTKKRKAISIKTDFHGQAVVKDPKSFGLTKDFLLRTLKLRPAELRTDVILPIEKHLFGKGWTHVTWSRNIEELSIRGGSNADVMKALNWFLDTGKTPESVSVRSMRGRIASGGTLRGEQIQQFAKTGKIVKRTAIGSTMAQFRDHVELDEKIRNLDKWWYDTKKRKAISITTDFHGQAVVKDPEKFGLTMRSLVGRPGLSLTQRELRSETIQRLDDHLFRKGWVQVTWASNIEEVTIRGESNSEIQKTVKWFLSKINPTPAQTIIDSDTHGFDRIVGDGIDVFAKTGKVVKRTEIGSTMARFR